MKKLLGLCSLLAVVVLPLGARAGLIQYRVTVIVGSDEQVFSGEGQADADGYFERSLVSSEQAIGDAAIDILKLKINSDPEVGVEFGIRNYGSLAVTGDVLCT